MKNKLILILCISLSFLSCSKEVDDNPEKPPQEENTANIETNIYDDFFLFGSNMGWLNNNWREIGRASCRERV